MAALTQSSHRFLSKSHIPLWDIARPAVLTLQNNLGLFPRKVCLISGAPRSGTSALCAWLGYQPGVEAYPESRILVSVHKFMEEIHRFASLDSDSKTIISLARHLVYDFYSSSRIIIGKRLLVDKEPLEPIAFPSKEYGQFISNVRELFPESKLLLAVREPIATIWSMRGRDWGSSLTNMQSKRFTLEEYVENWCSCADIVLKYCSDPGTYVVQFGRLVNDSENESRKVFDFLDISRGNPFQPRETSEIGFTEEERERITRLVRPQLEALGARGISDLS